VCSKVLRQALRHAGAAAVVSRCRGLFAQAFTPPGKVATALCDGCNHSAWRMQLDCVPSARAMLAGFSHHTQQLPRCLVVLSQTTSFGSSLDA
jgi:hypothetical protein